jgi:hypothetical protein
MPTAQPPGFEPIAGTPVAAKPRVRRADLSDLGSQKAG